MFLNIITKSTDIGIASRAAKNLYRPIVPLLDDLSADMAFDRLKSQVYKVLVTDNDHEPGQRRIMNGNIELLKGFEFNNDVNIVHPLYKKCVGTLSEDKITIKFPQVRPFRDIISPFGAAYFKLCFGVIFVNTATGRGQGTREVLTGYQPLNGTMYSTQFNAVKVIQGESIGAILLGIKFYRISNNKLRPHPNVEYNSLIIHNIWKC